MRITMLETRRGSHDQYRFFRYEAGKTYNLPTPLAKAYLRRGIAVEEADLSANEKKVNKKSKNTTKKKEAV